jgi:hypothetical protein
MAINRDERFPKGVEVIIQDTFHCINWNCHFKAVHLVARLAIITKSKSCLFRPLQLYTYISTRHQLNPIWKFG